MTKGTFGQLTCEWQYLFEEFTKDPMIVENRRLRIEAKVQIITPPVIVWISKSASSLIVGLVFHFEGESEVCLPCQRVWEDHQLPNS